MENEQNQELKQPIQKPKKKWFTLYFVVGSIWYFAQSFNKHTLDALIILVIAILAGIFYYRLKFKIKVKNEALKIILTLSVLWLVSALLIGFLTGLTANLNL